MASQSDHPSSAPSFGGSRQIERYFAGARTANHVIPFSVEEMERRAHAVMSPQNYDWVAGAAGNGDAARENVRAFDRWKIVPRMLVDVDQRDYSIQLFGKNYPAPFMIAPIGVHAAAHAEGEVATARAAGRLGIPFCASTVSTCTFEDIAEANGSNPRWYQLYWSKEPELTKSFIRRAEAAGYEALVVTLDTQMLGWREQNLELGFLPFLRGIGIRNYMMDPVFRDMLGCDPEQNIDAAAKLYLDLFSNKAHTWKDLEFLRQNTKLPILLKGIQHPDDARRAVEAGMDGIVVSNHGGRQVAGGIATIEILPEIVDAVGDQTTVLLDSGIRRGADVFKAMALGARAVMVGRPFMWALAIGGEAGVHEFLRNFLSDIDITFALAGRADCGSISRDDLR
jgi:isopentenyl diphosphate isomerase/L-lactate dehydrogenase-like FMN-dependent dehydrogenase